MKQTLLLPALLIALLAPALASAAPALHAGERYLLPQSGSIAGDLYNAGAEAVIAGSVAGDAALIGGTITLDGSVSQDALLAGGTIILSGAVGDDARLVGGDITVSGTVSGDLAAAGGTVRIASGAVIEGDLLVASGAIIIDGQVIGNVRVLGGQATIAGSVGGTVWSYADRLSISATGVIGGDLVNRSANEPAIAAGAVIGGQVINEPAAIQPHTMRSALAAAATMGFFMLLASGLLCLWFFKNRSSQLVSHALAHFGKTFLGGLLALVIVPLVGLLCFFSLVGIPVGALALLLYGLTLILARIFAGIMLGGWINRAVFKKPDQVFTWQTVIGGNVVLMLLGFVPVLGGAVSFLFTLAALGAFWGYLYRHFWVHR